MPPIARKTTGSIILIISFSLATTPLNAADFQWTIDNQYAGHPFHTSPTASCIAYHKWLNTVTEDWHYQFVRIEATSNSRQFKCLAKTTNRRSGKIGFEAGFYGTAYRHGDNCHSPANYNPSNGECEIAELEKGAAAPNPSCSINNDQFYATNGNNFQKEKDINSNIRFERFYNSSDRQWRHNYSAILQNLTSKIKITFSDGKEATFIPSDKKFDPLRTERGQLTRNLNTWTYTASNNDIYDFDNDGNLINLYSSKQKIKLEHSWQGIKLTDNFNNELKIAEDEFHQPTKITTPTMTIKYNYSLSRNLESAIYDYPSGSSTRRYHYSNGLLTGITDERGIRYATWTYDDQGRAISSEHAGGAEKVTVAYNADGSSTVTNALGKRTTYRFQTIQGVRRITAIEGEPSANCPNSNATFTYDDRGLVKTRTDNKGHVTTFDYNDRGLEVSRTEAYGTPQARTVITEWHPTLFLPLTVTEPDRVTTYRYDDQGRQLSQSVSQR